MLTEEAHVIVYGKVHGIGFRAKTKEYADTLHLKGFVRNLSDGSVEICVQGDKDKRDLLLEKLQEFFGQYIDKMETSFKVPSISYNKFRITLA